LVNGQIRNAMSSESDLTLNGDAGRNVRGSEGGEVFTESAPVEHRPRRQKTRRPQRALRRNSELLYLTVSAAKEREAFGK